MRYQYETFVLVGVRAGIIIKYKILKTLMFLILSVFIWENAII
jgi:hypothetical protein